MLDRPTVLQDFIDGMRAGDFSRLANSFEGTRPRVVEWDKQGAFADAPDVRAEALTCASFLGAVAVATYFLEQGVDPAAGAATGLNAFHWAANRGQLESVRMLLRAGAPLEVKNSYEGTVLGTAVWSAVHEPRPAHAQIIEELLQAGARVEAADYPCGDPAIDSLLQRFGATAD
jgi:hypothetical protein